LHTRRQAIVHLGVNAIRPLHHRHRTTVQRQRDPRRWRHF
jgi:hypothetical protein